MNNYIVFIKDNESKVITKDRLTRELSRDLKRQGFTQYPYTIEADNEKQAIEKLNEKGNEHLNALSDYSGNMLFYCVVIVGGLLLAYLFY